MSRGKLCQLILLLIAYRRSACVLMKDIPESEINELKAACVNNSFSLTFTGVIKAMYTTGHSDTCISTVIEDDEGRGIFHTLTIPYEDEDKCGVVWVEKNLWTVDVHVQLDQYLVTDVDLDYRVTCNYGNVTDDEMGNGLIERIVLPSYGNPVHLFDDMQQSNDVALYLEDQLTNHITHALIGQSVRLHVRKLGRSADCPTLPHNLQQCERTSTEDSPLRCDSLKQEPFRICNEILDPGDYIQNCQVYLDQLGESFPECAEDRKRKYICQLYELYECECQNKGLIIDWLPSEQCVRRSSLLYVDLCELFGKTEREILLNNGCGDGQHMPRNWHFYSSSSRSTRTQYFDLKRLVDDEIFTIKCNVYICTDAFICEKDCSTSSEERSIPGGEVSITTGMLYLKNGSPQRKAIDFLGTNNVESASGHWDGSLFTSENFSLFIAIVVLGFVIIVLSMLIVWLICRVLKKTSSIVSRSELGGMLASQSEESQGSGHSDPVALSYKPAFTPAPHAFFMPPTPLDSSSRVMPSAISDLPAGDRFDNETTVDICPPLSGRLSANVRFGFESDDYDDDDETHVKPSELMTTDGRSSESSTDGLLL